MRSSPLKASNNAKRPFPSESPLMPTRALSFHQAINSPRMVDATASALMFAPLLQSEIDTHPRQETSMCDEEAGMNEPNENLNTSPRSISMQRHSVSQGKSLDMYSSAPQATFQPPALIRRNQSVDDTVVLHRSPLKSSNHHGEWSRYATMQPQVRNSTSSNGSNGVIPMSPAPTTPQPGPRRGSFSHINTPEHRSLSTVSQRRKVRLRRNTWSPFDSYSFRTRSHSPRWDGSFAISEGCYSAVLDVSFKDVLLFLSLFVICVLSFTFGVSLVFVKSKLHTESIFTPISQPLQHSLPWKPSSKHRSRVTALFYNIYISSDPFLATIGRRIVEEQLEQVGTSFAAANGNLTIYYTMIGNRIDQEWIETLCSYRYNMTCQEQQYFHNANEHVTLEKLHQHCHQHPNEYVIYLHNKGSLHPGYRGQDRWRRTMTAAVTSQLCLDPPFNSTSNQPQCNACGMLFQPLPAPHFPGNMFSADCSYVVRLLAPSNYHTRTAITDAWIKSEVEVGLIQSKFSGLFPMEAHYTGKRRYESEHWLGSHPDLRPCDVSAHPSLHYWLNEDRDFTQEFQLAMAPRHNIRAEWLWYSYTSQNSTLLEPMKRIRDYFLLRGILYRYWAFYNVSPSHDSWVWRWFPDGDLWRTAVDEFGVALAINAMVQLPGKAQFKYPDPPFWQKVWNNKHWIPSLRGR